MKVTENKKLYCSTYIHFLHLILFIDHIHLLEKVSGLWIVVWKQLTTHQPSLRVMVFLQKREYFLYTKFWSSVSWHNSLTDETRLHQKRTTNRESRYRPYQLETNYNTQRGKENQLVAAPEPTKSCMDAYVTSLLRFSDMGCMVLRTVKIFDKALFGLCSILILKSSTTSSLTWGLPVGFHLEMLPVSLNLAIIRHIASSKILHQWQQNISLDTRF